MALEELKRLMDVLPASEEEAEELTEKVERTIEDVLRKHPELRKEIQAYIDEGKPAIRRTLDRLLAKLRKETP